MPSNGLSSSRKRTDGGNFQKDTTPLGRQRADHSPSNRSGRDLKTTKGHLNGQSLDRSESGISGDFEHLGGNEESVSYSIPESKFKGTNEYEAKYANKN